MNRPIIYSSKNVNDVYWVYQQANSAFLKHFKHQGDFAISFTSKDPLFSLAVEDASQSEVKWLTDKVLEIVKTKIELSKKKSSKHVSISLSWVEQNSEKVF